MTGSTLPDEELGRAASDEKAARRKAKRTATRQARATCEAAAAASRLVPFLAPTPVVPLLKLSERIGLEVWAKLETHQPTRSFKVRGALNALLSVTAVQRSRGVVTASQGNHGLALAYAARVVDAHATVFVSESVPAERVTALKEMGAEVRIAGASWDDANLAAQRHAKAVRALYVHPFNDPAVMGGQGTILLEVIQQLPGFAAVVASIGGGGLLSGLIDAARVHAPTAMTLGVETEGADRLFRSRAAGKIVRIPPISSVAVSLGARQTESPPFETIMGGAADLVRVSDEQALASLRSLFAEEGLVAEPAATCCLAALEHRLIVLPEGSRVVVVLCGANVSAGDYAKWLREGT